MENSPTPQTEVVDPLATLPRQFSVDELHEGIIRYENEELVYEHPELCPTIEIVDDNAIAVERHHITLSNLRVFVLNALRLNQGYAVTSEDIHDLGFRGERTTININLQWLMQAMERGGNEAFIEREQPHANGQAFYTLLPEVRFVDRRDELQLSPVERLLKECDVITPSGAVRMKESGSIDFAAPRFRVRANLAMINEYRDQAKVELAIARLFDQRLGSRKLGGPVLPLKRYQLPSPSETAQLLQLKEYALATYLEGLASGEAPSDEQRQTIIEGIRAGYELFARHIDIVDKYARIYSDSRTPYAELYQESAMQLLEVVLIQGYDNSGNQNFQFVAREMIKHYKGHGIYTMRLFNIRPVNYPSEYFKDSQRLQEAMIELKDELGHEPSIITSGARANMGPDKALAIFALDQRPYSLVYTHDEVEFVPPELRVDDFSDRVLGKMERTMAIQHIFASDKLTKAEKVVLSLHYQIFQSDLCGVELKQSGNTFRYPETEKEFTALTVKPRTLHSLAVDIMNFQGHYAIDRHQNGLRKAKSILKAHPDFDAYGHMNTKEARQIAEQEEIIRQTMIDTALVVSPNRRLGRAEIRSLASAKKIPFNEAHIIEYFGTLPAFQIACGFEPDKQWMFRDISDEEAISLALRLKPDGPLTDEDIAEFSKQAVFPGRSIIKRLFGSLPNFQIACGFKPDKGVINQMLTTEDVIKRARELKPDGPIMSGEIRAYSKSGDLPSETKIKELFGSVPAFHKACGFTPHKKNSYTDLTKEQAIKRARELKPDGPMTNDDITAFSKQGDFPGQKVIKRLFGSVTGFRKACGYEPDKAVASQELTAEDVIKRARELKPDGPMDVSEVRAYSKQGDFVGYARVIKLFGTFANFKKACGFNES